MKTEILKKESILNTWCEPELLVAPNGLVVLSSGKHSDFTFEGCVIVKGRDKWEVGHISSDWSKDSFITFNEKITLEND